MMAALRRGMHVQVERLGSTTGMLIAPRHMALRRLGASGVVEGYVPGHGGDVWWIRQDDGVAAYSYTELREIGNTAPDANKQAGDRVNP